MTESIVVSLCARCGKPLDSDLPSWADTVNLTPDLLFVHNEPFGVETSVIDADVAFDWCTLECFMAWCYTAALMLNTGRRP